MLYQATLLLPRHDSVALAQHPTVRCSRWWKASNGRPFAVVVSAVVCPSARVFFSRSHLSPHHYSPLPPYASCPTPHNLLSLPCHLLCPALRLRPYCRRMQAPYRQAPPLPCLPSQHAVLLPQAAADPWSRVFRLGFLSGRGGLRWLIRDGGGCERRSVRFVGLLRLLCL